MIPLVMVIVSCNPFAPTGDFSFGGTSSGLSDQRSTEGVFNILRNAYNNTTNRDTSDYGKLFSSNFMFIYRDYDRGVDVSWGRDEEMRATYGLFRNVQKLDLAWNDTIATSMNSDSTKSSVTRSFNLTVTFNPSDIIQVNGYARLTMERQYVQNPWMIVRWNDEAY
jgi:hypothetical protein